MFSYNRSTGPDNKLSSLHNAVQLIYPTAQHRWLSVCQSDTLLQEEQLLLVRCFHRVSGRNQMQALWLLTMQLVGSATPHFSTSFGIVSITQFITQQSP